MRTSPRGGAPKRNSIARSNFLNAVVENIPETLVVKDAGDGRYVFVNRAGERWFGLARGEIIGKTTFQLLPADEADLIVMRDRQALRSGELVIEDHPGRLRDGRMRHVTSKRIAIRGKNGQPEYLLSVLEDVTERKQTETQIAHLALHDPLTDLPNRAAFTTRLDGTLDRAIANSEKFAVLCIDLDRFKEVNDLFGHAAGDEVLLEISRRMQAAVGNAFLARLGGDEFTVIVAEGTQPAATTHLAERLIAAMSDGIESDGRMLRVGMSIGVAIFPTDGTDAATLMRNADAALYRAKAEGRGAIRFFEAEMDRILHERRALQNDLAAAVTTRRIDALLSAAGQSVGPDHRFRSAAALGSSGAGLRAAQQIHPAGGRKRPDHPDRRMGIARSVPGGGILAQAAADRGQPVANPVPAGRPCGTRAFRSCSRPGSPPTGWCWKSLKAP